MDSSSHELPEEEQKILDVTNKLLEYVGIVSKKVLSIDELVRVGSSLFVAVIESLFHLRISGIIRSPTSQRDYAINAQLVVDCLSQQIQMDLQHITGESIVRGDLQSISNLVNIIFGIVSMTLSAGPYNKSVDSDFNEDMIETFIQPRSVDSISTHESDFRFEYTPTAASRGEIEHEDMYDLQGDEDEDELTVDEFLSGNAFLTRSEKIFELDQKLEDAAVRRGQLRRRRESLYAATNQEKCERSKKARQLKRLEEGRKAVTALELQKSSEEHVMLRRVYQGLLKKMHSWKIDEAKETKEQIRQLKADSEVERRSVDNLFQDQLRMLREQEVVKGTTTDLVVRAQRKMLSDLLLSQKQQQEKQIHERLDELAARRQRSSHFRREAHEDLLALLQVGSWEDSLRHHDARDSISSASKQKRSKNIRPSSAPMRRRSVLH